MSSTSNGSKDGKKGGGWVSPDLGGDGRYMPGGNAGQRRQAPKVTREQFNQRSFLVFFRSRRRGNIRLYIIKFSEKSWTNKCR